jgi:hypothetical protein
MKTRSLISIIVIYLAVWSHQQGSTSAQEIFVTYQTNIVGDHIGGVAKYSLSSDTLNPNFITGLQEAEGIAVSGSSVYVASQGVIAQYTTSGVLLDPSLLVRRDAATGLAVSGINIFTASQLNSGSIGEYNTLGATVNDNLITPLGAPVSIIVSGTNLFVGASDYVNEYTTSGVFVRQLLSGANITGSIAISGSDLFVSDVRGIDLFNLDNLTKFPLTIFSANPGSLASVGSDLIATDPLNNRVVDYKITHPPSGTTLAFSHEFSVPYPIAIAVIGVPEPSSMVLAILGLAALVGSRWRKT